MKIYNKIYLISKFIKIFRKKDPNLSSDLANTNYKKVTAHVKIRLNNINICEFELKYS